MIDLPAIPQEVSKYPTEWIYLSGQNIQTYPSMQGDILIYMRNGYCVAWKWIIKPNLNQPDVPPPRFPND